MTLTFGNRKEAKQDEGVLVGPPDVIMDVSNREVDGVIFVLASCDRNCRLVASKYDGDEHCSMSISVYSDEVLVYGG